MTYPGNPSLSPDVRQRTSATFEQSLDLAAQGREQEALAGCEFILGLDPLFQPARQLQDRLRSSERPLRIDDLRAPAPGPSAQPSATQRPASGLGAVLQHLLAKENYRQVMQIAGTQAQAIASDPRLQALVDQARAALAAEVAGAPAAAAAPAAADELLSFDTAEEPPARGAADFPSPGDAPAEDDLLDLQRLSLSLDQEHDDPLSEINTEPQLDDLGPDDEVAEGDPEGGLDFESGLDFEDGLDLEGGLEDLDTLDLDEDVLPELDEAAAAPVTPVPAEDLLAVEAAPPSFTAEPAAAGTPADAAIGAPFEAAGDDEDERIAELLDEGQESFDRGDYQGAIDLWSRIFLIDISNGEASSRIEEARRKKAELERQAEEIFHEGVGYIESESLEEAKDAFRRVLEVDPHHSLAQDYLEQLEAGKVPTVVSRQSEAADLDDLAAEALAAGGGAEASPSLEAAVQRDRIVVVKKTDKRLIALAAAVAILVVGAGAYLFLNKDKLFPNTAQTVAPPPPRIDPIVRATRLHEAGQTEKALEQLREVPAEDPSYAKAVALIDQWEALITATEQVDTGPSPELLARRNLLLAAARQAHREQWFIKARKYFEQANKILALDPGDRALMLNCEAELQDLAQEVKKFEEREYAAILPDLWRRRERAPDDHDVNQLIADSYFNLALVDLQRGDPTAAAEKLKDALEVDPENEDLRRLQLFAETYSGRAQDLLYLIFVKYLPSRDL